MFKKQHLALAIAATLAAGSAQAALETSVVLKNETARFIKDGIRTGEATDSTDTTGAGKETFKFENTAKIFLNDALDNGTSWHGELNIVRDTKAIDGYDGHETNTQKDWLRELYVDTSVGDWDLRLGKQQVVWGTADGIKLLDNVNPTDWSEFNQNAPADARIPVWMINAERYLENGDNVQLVVSQAERSKIAGMDISSGSTRDVGWTYGVGFGGSGNANLVGEAAGHPFIMKGVDTITGRVNGFFNIGAAMGGVTDTFYNGGFTNPNAGASAFYASAPPELTSVAAFAQGFNAASVTAVIGGVYGAAIQAAMCGAVGSGTGADCLKGFTEASNQNVTNLFDNAGVAAGTAGGSYDPTNPNSMWEYMPNASFATFNAFVDMTTEYVRKEPDNTDANFGTRYRTNFDNGLNLTMSYQYAYDSNPVVNIHWANVSGAKLTPEITTGTNGLKTVHLKDGSGTYYGATTNYTGTGLNAGTDPEDYNVTNTAGNRNVKLVFEETLERTHGLGSAFDYAIETDSNPVVLRGEFLYQKDVRTPVINRAELVYGNLTEALKMEKADFFKYVIGADTTVMTDMMLSGQFIQFRNLDYVDSTATCSTAIGQSVNCSRYTGDQASMHLSNGLQKAEENKEFYSLFLSKPFGESGEGRWNNIFIYEEGGGKWNRFDVEYGFDDQLIGTFEVNKYFGDNNTMFGQFENASNVQIGLKYLLQ